jgi:hypothetical protein
MSGEHETRRGYEPKVVSFEGCTVAARRLEEEDGLDPAVEASRMDLLSGWGYLGLGGHDVFYKTGERAVSEMHREFLMFAAVVSDRELKPAEERLVQRRLEAVTLSMARSVAEQYQCDVAAVLLEPTPADMREIEDSFL